MALLLARVPSSQRGGRDVRVPSSLRGELLARVPSNLHGGLLALVPSNQTAARTPPSMVKFRHGKYNTTVCDINVSVFFQKGLRWLLMCAPLLKLDDFFTTAYMCHVMKPCQVSCFLGEFLIYWD